VLVLSRKIGQRILIGDKISVTVIKVSGGGVRIGIDAPDEMPVMREELAAEIAQQAAQQAKVELRGQRSKTDG
jgi:carbon storage regulator